MTAKPIVPSVLGSSAERALQHEIRTVTATLRGLDSGGWQRPSPLGGAPVVTVVAHLAEGLRRLADAWQARVDAEETDALLHTFDDPGSAPDVAMDVSDPDAVRESYLGATADLLRALSTIRQDEWSWPVWSPLGGLETLAEAVRRTLAHHHVHTSDIARALGMRVEPDDDVTRLVTEFVLDALARRGGDAVTDPLVVQVVTDPPGPGTWSLMLGQEELRHEVHNVFTEFVGTHPEATARHRVVRGTEADARITVRAGGETLWRAAFQRGSSWDDLHVHGDDEAKGVWHRLLARTIQGPAGIGPVQH